MVWRRSFCSKARAACVTLTGGPIRISDVTNVSRNLAQVSISPHAKSLIEASRQRVDNCIDSGKTYYGINTGFGSLVGKSIDRQSLDVLQTNLIRSHASGAGAPLDKTVVRAMMLCLVASLSRGLSGVRLQVVEKVIQLLNQDITPVVPSIGSVGASGDLAPLAHAVQILMGEGSATLSNGEVVSGAKALEMANLSPTSFQAKEGLGLINGTHLMCGSAALICEDFVQLFKAALCACSLSLEAQQASHGFLDPRINEARVFEGGKLVAKSIRELVSGSEIHADRKKASVNVQDPYSIRCVAPVLGSSWEAYQYARRSVELELGAVTDNPLVFENPDSGDTEIVSAGNFHGMPMAMPLDMMSIAITHIAGMSERRTNLMISDPNTPMLAVNPGVESGLMITQYTQAACMNELQGLASPASVSNISTCANVEDYNSWGPRSAAKAMRSLELAQIVISAELLAGAEKLERRRPSVSGDGVEEIHRLVRSKVERLRTDRSHSGDLEALQQLIRGNSFDHLVQLQM